MSSSSKLWWMAVLCAGCVADAPNATGSAIGGPLEDDGYVGQQGRLVLGFRAPDVRTFSFPGLTGARVASKGQVITNELKGEKLTGASITAVSGATTIAMRIKKVIPPGESEKWQYELEEQDATGQWVQACVQPDLILPPLQPTSLTAIAMPGMFDADGLYRAASTQVTFSCHSGVAAKCDGWGYPATMTPPSVTEHGLPVTVSGADMLQACTRMARADYCAQGMPNTLDGTPIHRDDIFQSPPGANGYAFEAAWPGVAVTGRIVQRPAAICLTKLRWSTLPLGGTCPLVLPDPRVDAKGTFCEDMPEDKMEQKGARTYSASAFLDAGLYSHTDGVTGTRFVTSHLVPGAVGKQPEWLLDPAPSIGFPQLGQRVQLEATIFQSKLPDGVSTDGLVRLTSYQCSDGDLVTTTAEPEAGCTPIAEEGLVHAPSTSRGAPLRRWYMEGTKRSYTTAAAPSTMIAQGWKAREVVGGAIRAPIDVNVRWGAIASATYSLAVQLRTGEWIAPCIDTTATSVVYRGVCTSAANRRVDHGDIVAMRVTSTAASIVRIGTLAYDGVASDAHVDLPDSRPTALAVSWHDAGPGYTYALELTSTNGEKLRCVGDDLIANSTSYVHTGTCWSLGTTLALFKTAEVRVCVRKDKQDVGCGSAAYDGRSSQLEVELPKL